MEGNTQFGSLYKTYNVKSPDLISFSEINGVEASEEESKVTPANIGTNEEPENISDPVELKRKASRLVDMIKLNLDSFILKIACIKPNFDSESQQHEFLAKFKILENLKKMTEILIQKEASPNNNTQNYQEIKDSGKLFIGFFDKKNFSGFAAVQRNDRTYVGTIKNKLFEGYGAMAYQSGSIFIGNWKNGLKEGFGRYIGCDGAEYTGDFKNDKMDGNAIVKYANGDIFQGEFRDGKQNGNGKYSFKNSNFWEYDQGIWKDGKLNDVIDSRRGKPEKKANKKKEEKKEPRAEA